MKQRNIIAYIMLLFCAFFLVSCHSEEIILDKAESFYSDMKVEDGKVYIYCSLLIENKAECEKNIALTAVLADDAENGLLGEAEAWGYSLDLTSTAFCLGQGENRLDVVFVGQHAGGDQKHDRLLPPIRITELS